VAARIELFDISASRGSPQISQPTISVMLRSLDLEHRPPVLGLDQRERREVRQVDTVVEALLATAPA
jgi:hypothetical protein